MDEKQTQPRGWNLKAGQPHGDCGRSAGGKARAAERAQPFGKVHKFNNGVK